MLNGRDQVQNHLFETNAFNVQTKRFSLSAINVQRGRDHGLPPYNKFRRLSGLAEVKLFKELVEIPAEVRRKLRRIYGNGNVNDVDAFTGGISEMPMEDALLGPTFASKLKIFIRELFMFYLLIFQIHLFHFNLAIVARQFRDLKFGDRYYYENGDNPIIRFKVEQLNEIKKTSMARIVCDNIEIDSIQPNAFAPISDKNQLLSCDSLPRVDLSLWRNEPLPNS
jgi:peroxidase